MKERAEISVVVPVYNEEGNLEVFYRQLSSVFREIELAYELILVNDGSTDGSLRVMYELNRLDDRVKILNLSRNFGHQAALSAGLDFAKGDAVITMDADLQHPPGLIPEMVRKWETGVEIVNTLRTGIGQPGAVKTISSRIFYGLMRRIANVRLPKNAADYRLLDRKVVEIFRTMKERARFWRGLVSWVGYRQEYLSYQPKDRFSGQTKYSFPRMLRLALDGITSFSSAPLRIATYLGVVTTFFSFAYIVYAVYIRVFTDHAIAGWTSVLVSVLFIGGVQLISLGIIGEYVSRIFDETKGRPLYILESKVGF